MIYERTVYFESYGCSANKFDLEIMLGLLVNAGYKVANEAETADVILINTCGVKKPTEDRMLNRLSCLGSLNKPLIIAGCLPKINLPAIRRSAPSFRAALDPCSVDKILEAANSAENGEENRLFFSKEPRIKLLQPKVKLDKPIEIVQIAEGCLGTCSFCCVRYARGELFSYPKETIVSTVRKSVLEGMKEIWITSQDNGAYGLDIGTNLAELLEDICKIEGEFLIRIGMMNPGHVLRIADRLINVYKDGKIFKFLHLPVQSGDDEVLTRMKRFYSVDDFKRIVLAFRREVPEATLSTDIICGFPGETEEAFIRTIELIEELKPDIVNISRFFPRPHTPAQEMNQTPIEEVKERSRRLTRIVKEISHERNKAWLNWEGKILVDEKGKDDTWIGRNYAYKPIVVGSKKNLLGKFLHIFVNEALPTYLKAEILKQNCSSPKT